jgi:hypothetical protein
VYGKLILSGMVNNNDIISNAGIPYSKITLTNSIVDGDIENSAAIQYSKLSLSGKITNNDIVASAGIPYSKLSVGSSIRASDINSISGTNGQVLTASGGLASWTTVTATNATNALNIDINTYPLTYTETANRTPFYTHTTDGYNALKSSPLYYYVEKTGTIMPPTPDVKRLYVPSLNCSGVLYVDSDIISSAGTINLNNGSVNVNNGNVTISGGSLIGALDSTCTGSTAALNTSTTAIATTAFIQAAIQNATTYKINLLNTNSFMISGGSAVTRLIVGGENVGRTATLSARAPMMLTINASEFATNIAGEFPSLRLRVTTLLNNHSASGSITYGLQRVASVSGTTSDITYNLNNHLSGLNVVQSPLAANNIYTSTTTFSLSGSGLSGTYVLTTLNSNTIPVNCCINMNISLDVIYS